MITLRLWPWQSPTERKLAKRWAVVLVLSYVLAAACYALFPPVVLIPPALTAALAWPVIVYQTRRFSALAQRKPWLRWIEPILVMVILSLVASVQFRHVFAKNVPIDSYDHHIMIARAQLLAEGLLRGKLVHWSHLFQGGDSLTDLYPVFLNFVTAAMHALAPTGTPFVETYTVFCVAAWVLRGAAVYHLARRFAGVPIATAVTLASLFEVGAEVFDGIWCGALLWGMVHNNLAITLALFAIAAQVDLSRRVSALRIFSSILLTCLTAVAHPLGLLTLTVSIVAFLASALFGDGPRRRIYWAVAAPLLGVLMGSVWTLPYVHALKNYGFNGSLVGVDYNDIGTGFINGSVPVSSFSAFIGAGILAVVVALISKKRPLVATATIAVLFLLLALVPFLVQTRVLTYLPSFLEAQQRRALTVLKAVIVPAAAFLGHTLLERRRISSSLSVATISARCLIFGLLVYGPARALANGLVKVSNDLKAQVSVPAKGSDGRRTHDTDNAHRAAMAWIKERRDADPSATPWRVVLLDRFDLRSHPHWFWAQGIETGTPIVDYGWVSANFIGFRPRELNETAVRDWNIRYAVGVGSQMPFPNATQAFKSGSYRVWELSGYDDNFVVAPPGVSVSNLRIEDDFIRFNVSGAPAEGAKLKVRSAWFPRWQAFQGDQTLQVLGELPQPGAKPRQEQLAVQVHDGEVTLACTKTMPRFWSGFSLSLLTLIGSVWLVTKKHHLRVESLISKLSGSLGLRLKHLGDRAMTIFSRRRWLRWTALAFALLLLVAARMRGTTDLLVPAIESVGLDMHVLSEEGRNHCLPEPHLGRYECILEGEPIATLRGGIGETTVPDDSGEYGKKWPANQIWFAKADTTVELTFSRINATSGQLYLETFAHGQFSLAVTAGQETSAEKQLKPYNSTTQFAIGDGLSSTEEVTVTVHASAANSTLLFRASTRAPYR